MWLKHLDGLQVKIYISIECHQEYFAILMRSELYIQTEKSKSYKSLIMVKTHCILTMLP